MSKPYATLPLEASLRRRFRVVETELSIGGRSLAILHPASADELIDERDFERDERLPYWADLWPSSRILGARVLDLSGEQRTLLELGCGAGLVATCASLAGFRVTASDYYDDALRFARANAARNGAAPLETLCFDWRRLPAEHSRYDVVVASDVLYERPYGALVASTIAAMLGDDGYALVADPGRVARDAFLDALPRHGLRVREKQDRPFEEGVIKQTITLYEIARAR